MGHLLLSRVPDGMMVPHSTLRAEDKREIMQKIIIPLGFCALLAVPLTAKALDCGQWNTKEYFQTATGEDVNACLAAGADPNARDGYGRTPLYKAAANGNVVAIKTLLAAGAEPQVGDERTPHEPGGTTPLHTATWSSTNPAVIEALVKGGADLNARDEAGGTPLYEASLSGNLVAIKALLAAGAEVNARSDVDYMPLHATSSKAVPAVIEALLEAGADVNARANPSGGGSALPLHVAAKSNENPAVIETLLKAGAEVGGRDSSGETPLHWAARSNENPRVIEVLLKAGVDVGVRNKSGQTPLHKAALNNRSPTVIELLLAAGAEVEPKDNRGKTPLDLALWSDRNPTGIQALQAAVDKPSKQ